MIFKRPMLAAPTKPEDLQKIKFPKLASPKIDGIRAIRVGSDLVSRTLKLVPNTYTRELFSNWSLAGLDGELIVGEPNDKNLMQQTTSGVMSRDGEPKVRWCVFDDYTCDGEFDYRYSKVIARVSEARSYGVKNIEFIPHTLLESYSDLLEYEERMVNAGFEGVMLRDPMGPYKQNRSTLKEEYLLKVKRFEDSEAIIIGVKEQRYNFNEATTDERGYTKRSSAKAGKVDAGVLGALLVRDIHTNVEFEVGTGFTAEQRANLWEGRKYLEGKLIVYKHFPIGVKDLPRFPTFKAFRDKRDVG